MTRPTLPGASRPAGPWDLEPEQSTTAIIVLHPQAKYFRV